MKIRRISRDVVLGVLSLAGAIVLFSSIEVASKIVGGRVHPFQLVFLRFFTTGVILLAMALPVIRARMNPLGLRDYAVFALNGLVGVSVSLSLFHFAIMAFEKAASCAVVFSANPIFVVIFARFINKEPWSPRKLASVCAGAAGVGMFAWESGAFTAQSLAAIGIMACSAATFALSTCISRRVIARYGVYTMMGFSALFGSLAVLPLAAVATAANGVGGIVEAWAPALYIVLAGTALAYCLYYFGLLNCSAFLSSMMFFLKPVLASLLAFAILGERFNPPMLAGTVLILSGLFSILPLQRKSPS